MLNCLSRVWVSLLLVLSCVGIVNAQQGGRAPSVVSPEMTDSGVIFRVYAPKAEKVTFYSNNILDIGSGRTMVKGSNGVWEVTLKLVPGAYRYNFDIDGVQTIDPRNPKTSESNDNTWSFIYVPGVDFMDTKDVPHGAVASVTYYSKSLGKFRRMHVYTPPGYELGKGEYPVFYLLHGATDSDDSWTSVGRASFIFDNLIAAGKAKPMVVVMPAGHTGPYGAIRVNTDASGVPFGDFLPDFNNEVVPYVESHYRIKTDRASRAIAGLSMGGSHTLNIAFPNLEKYAYIGVFSSGLFELNRNFGGDQTAKPWDQMHKDKLTDPELKKGLKLLWFATGRDDFLLNTTRQTVELLKKYDFDVVYKETEGAHDWVNWQKYLNEFAPLLFQ